MLPSPGQGGLLLVCRKLRFASGIPSRIRIQRPPALEIEAGARGHAGETPMLLWTDCRADLLAEGAGEIDRSPTVNVVRNPAMSVLEMSKLPSKAGRFTIQSGANRDGLLTEVRRDALLTSVCYFGDRTLAMIEPYGPNWVRSTCSPSSGYPASSQSAIPPA